MNVRISYAIMKSFPFFDLQWLMLLVCDSIVCIATLKVISCSCQISFPNVFSSCVRGICFLAWPSITTFKHQQHFSAHLSFPPQSVKSRLQHKTFCRQRKIFKSNFQPISSFPEVHSCYHLSKRLLLCDFVVMKEYEVKMHEGDINWSSMVRYGSRV